MQGPWSLLCFEEVWRENNLLFSNVMAAQAMSGSPKHMCLKYCLDFSREESAGFGNKMENKQEGRKGLIAMVGIRREKNKPRAVC